MFREADLAADSYRIGFIQGRNRTDAALAARVVDIEAQLMKIADTGMAPAEDFGKDGCTCLAMTLDGPCEVSSCQCFHHEDLSKTCTYCGARIDEHVGLSNMSCPTDEAKVAVDSAEVVEEEPAKPSGVKEPPHRYKCPGCTREYSLPPPSGSAYPHCPECSTDTRKVMMSKIQVNRP